MGFWSRIIKGEKAFPFETYDPAQRVLQPPYEPFNGFYSGSIPVADPGVPLHQLTRVQVDHFWRTQPNVRKVVDFIARNVASIPLHTYERNSDTDRARVRDHQIPRTLGAPSRGTTPFRFWRAVLSDGLLYDRWAVLMVPTTDGGLDLVQIPSWRLWLRTDALRQVNAAFYFVDQADRRDSDRDGWRELDLDMLIFDHGYAPTSAGLSPVETLQDVLTETARAVAYRNQLWENGARVSDGWIERPAGAEWSPEARERFRLGFRDSFTGNGPDAGGWPLMEDGMKLHERSGFSPNDTQDLEGRRLTSIEVASAYHIAPELVGAREGTYSNVDAFRQMLYRDSLGPYITAWEQAINAQLTAALAGGRNLYVEAHIDAKLRGSFEEQAKVKQSATGAPWLTRNEARALENRPPVEGGDELVVPLNVLVGGQASPQDSGRQNQAARKAATRGPETSKALTPSQGEQLQRVLSGFFERQGRSVLSAINAGSDWWDGERWDRELADDLLRVSSTIAGILGAAEAERMGYPDAYDVDQTVAFLRKVSEDRASGINETTRQQLEAAIQGDGEPAQVFETAVNDRSLAATAALGTFVAGFANVEAGRQVARVEGVVTTKTWVTGTNPRPTHAAMNGQTVPIGDPFSNGMDFPGQGGPDDAGCNCTVAITIVTD